MRFLRLILRYYSSRCGCLVLLLRETMPTRADLNYNTATTDLLLLKDCIVCIIIMILSREPLYLHIYSLQANLNIQTASPFSTTIRFLSTRHFLATQSSQLNFASSIFRWKKPPCQASSTSLKLTCQYRAASRHGQTWRRSAILPSL